MSRLDDNYGGLFKRAAEEFWRKVVSSSPELVAGDSESLVERAIDRLAEGDVRPTRYGFRVAVRRDLGDTRVLGQAYWLGFSSHHQAERVCLCRSKRTHGRCSHELAVEIFQAGYDRVDPDYGKDLPF